ncbi:helix-turn-helix domain-containing protein [Trichlorobacter lovleyi]|uniref:helix-turn-helix domain-containing protein n=1 Tax=Trichlorobacter lovleyi TaxID=313985 RepID=UPI003D0C338B
MAARGRGGGKTPEKVTKLLQDAVNASSIRAVARESGLTQSAVYRYLQGIGEPSLATLERLSVYFGVSVAELRGERVKRYWRVLDVHQGCYEGELNLHFNMLQDLIEIHDIIPDRLKPTEELVLEMLYGDVLSILYGYVEEGKKELFETEGFNLEYLSDFSQILYKVQDITMPPSKDEFYSVERNRIDTLLSQIKLILELETV